MGVIEVLISIVIVGALIVLFAASMNLTTMNKRMERENVAYHIANKKIEEIRAVTYDSLPASASFTDAQLSQLPSSSAAFTVSDYAGYTGVKQVVVTVSWNDGRARSISLRTLIGTGGINPQ